MKPTHPLAPAVARQAGEIRVGPVPVPTAVERPRQIRHNALQAFEPFPALGVGHARERTAICEMTCQCLVLQRIF